jgi:hypothetical protein
MHEAGIADAGQRKKVGHVRMVTTAGAIAGAISGTPCTCYSAGMGVVQVPHGGRLAMQKANTTSSGLWNLMWHWSQRAAL